jgi:DNA helicase II / ATP-dependent DNA helicase PcrA
MVEGLLGGLNEAQRAAALHGAAAEAGPLLIIAGAGSGKTGTLAHRVARLVLDGADPDRILLLTFSRRAALEMTRRAQNLVTSRLPGRRTFRWAGTFHAVANRLLRLHAHEIGLDPAFTVLDRGDSADLLDLLRHRLELSKTRRRFPKKDTCLAIHSRVINTQASLDECLADAFPWCREWSADLRKLFRAYAEAKAEHHVLDYDDLLLAWHHWMSDPEGARRVGSRFDHVLVDEYQDTNALQAAVLVAMKPDGAGVTVVGDDAQAIYSFRGATVRNILDFPRAFTRAATVVTLEENYRSTQPILDGANAVIAKAPERFTKNLHSSRPSRQSPRLVTVEDETLQAEHVADRVLLHREAGIALRHQAVLFRAAHHADALEVELSRRNIPFVKYGGLKFLESAHVKDLLAILRWAENPRDALAAFRVLQLLPGVGPSVADRAFQHLRVAAFSLQSLAGFAPPPSSKEAWPHLCAVFDQLASPDSWPADVGAARRWYQPHLERIHDDAAVRAADLDQLERIAAEYSTRERFLSELTLDPPEASGAEAGPPVLDEDFLVLSTIHSAKGQEWDVVFVLNVVDGCIPSDLTTGDAASIAEERRLLYVAMTRARDELYLLHPLRMYIRHQPKHGDRHVYTPRSRFLGDDVLDRFERSAVARGPQGTDGAPTESVRVIDVAARIRAIWS